MAQSECQENHVLYYFPTCPYCHKVLSFAEDHGIHLELRDAHDEANKAALISIGGKYQVPCLVENGKALYESDDIINYLASEL